MPTRADIEAATPRCPGPVVNVGLPTRPCARPMVSAPDRMVWCCPVHGSVLSWANLVACQQEYRATTAA